ncbi:RNA polymerase sigma-70 factor (ECF subfamily) [Archangium gephyra]|uniref:DNA-binding regulatory protein n=1 Tax=Archangium gephyra TaxID=48 RepID=A0AAC8TDC6_9BACT|nr:sigma-70 family RNA polymerase sigma factor [Archangium gephyra]AKJ01847.1 putative DNA-binding regulatory protein [Archangium gephyra]REG34654.1 RNA polymerase sigma-70 factor (ECF subfamily) [Archangium gephyra]
MSPGLAQAFVAAREGSLVGEPLAALEERLGRGLSTARAAWPGVELEGARFAAHLARHLPADSPSEALEQLHLTDLYLACACAEGLPLAHAAFEARVLPEVHVAVSRLKLPPSSVDEVRQLVRQKMLVPGPDTPARLAAYPGTGPLSGWVRAAALWIALDLQRQRSNQDVSMEDSTLSLLVDPGDDPELVYLKTTYRAEFNTAFTQALANLSPRERNTLRLKYLDGLSIDQLGALYGVHRATAARWVVAAQQALLEETRRLLTERLRLTGSQLDSVLRLISSQLDVSLSRLLRSRLD